LEGKQRTSKRKRGDAPGSLKGEHGGRKEWKGTKKNPLCLSGRRFGKGPCGGGAGQNWGRDLFALREKRKKNLQKKEKKKKGIRDRSTNWGKNLRSRGSFGLGGKNVEENP